MVGKEEMEGGGHVNTLHWMEIGNIFVIQHRS